MATYSASQNKTITLVGSQVDTITLTGAGELFKIWQSSTTPIYFTIAGVGETPATPTVAGDNTYVSMNNYPDSLPWRGTGIVIKVISAGTGTVNFTLH